MRTNTTLNWIVSKIAGVPQKDIDRLFKTNPRNRREEAMKALGLQESEIVTIKQMRKLSPTSWSLQYLGIPTKVYTQYLKEQKRMREEAKSEEYPDIYLQAETDRAMEAVPKIDGYIEFQQYLINTTKDSFKHTKKWRLIPPTFHFEAAKRILEKALEKESFNLLDIFRVNLFIYYGTYNAIMGVRVVSKRKAA